MIPNSNQDRPKINGKGRLKSKRNNHTNKIAALDRLTNQIIANKKEREHSDKRREVREILSTALVIAAVAISAATFWFTHDDSIKALQAAKIASEAAIKNAHVDSVASIKMAHDDADSTLRETIREFQDGQSPIMWVKVPTGNLTYIHENGFVSIAWTYNTQNFGKSPAINETEIFTIYARGKRVKKSQGSHSTLIAPNEITEGRVVEKDIWPEAIFDDERKNPGLIKIVLTIRYYDPFRRLHTSEFYLCGTGRGRTETCGGYMK